MLKKTDKELIEIIKNSEHITIDLVNDILEADSLKSKETTDKLNFITIWLPSTKCVEKLWWYIYYENHYWQTVVGYWFLKKLKQDFPGFDFYLPEEEPKSINSEIISKLIHTILMGATKIIDILFINGDIGVVKETKQIVNQTNDLGLKDIERLNITEKDYNLINQLLSDLGENQRLEIYWLGTDARVRYMKATGPKIYSTWKNSPSSCYSDAVLEKLWIINETGNVRLFEFTDDYVIEEKNFDSIVNNEKKREQEQLKRERLNKKFQGNKK